MKKILLTLVAILTLSCVFSTNFVCYIKDTAQNSIQSVDISYTLNGDVDTTIKTTKNYKLIGDSTQYSFPFGKNTRGFVTIKINNSETTILNVSVVDAGGEVTHEQKPYVPTIIIGLSNPITGISTPSTPTLKPFIYNNTLNINTLTPSLVYVYNLSGQLIYSNKVNGNILIDLPTNGLYIVKVDKEIFKLIK